MTLRIGTYISLVTGVPTVVGEAYDLDLFDINAPMGKNFKIGRLRDGRTRLVYDTKALYEISATMILPVAHIDEKGFLVYLGITRYLANNLFHHYKYHLPIVFFMRGLNDVSNKAYVAYIIDFDQAIAGTAMAIDSNRMHLSRMTPIRTWTLGLHVTMTGAWVDFGDVTTTIWESRT